MGDHHLGDGLSKKEVALQVHVEHEVVRGLGVLERWLWGIDTRVVDQNIDTSKVFGGGVNHSIDVGLRRRISGYHEAFSTRCSHRGGGLFELRHGATRDRDVGAELGEAYRKRTTKTAPTACYQGFAASEAK